MKVWVVLCFSLKAVGLLLVVGKIQLHVVVGLMPNLHAGYLLVAALSIWFPVCKSLCLRASNNALNRPHTIASLLWPLLRHISLTDHSAFLF